MTAICESKEKKKLGFDDKTIFNRLALYKALYTWFYTHEVQ
jgi:hypothetical protein